MLDQDLPVYEDASIHRIECYDAHRHCAWGAKFPAECQQGQESHSKVLGEIVNGIRPRLHSRQIHTVCVACDVALCIKGNCYNKWHASLYIN